MVRGCVDMTVKQRRNVFNGRVIAVDVETVELPNGTDAELEVIRHPGGAAIVALNTAGEVCLLRHYRHAVGAWLWELPAGKLDRAEPPLEAARRELEEETGLRAGYWAGLGGVITSPGVFTEVVHLFLAQQLEQRAASPEASEVFEIAWLPLPQAVQRALAGDIDDAKTVVGLLRAERQLRR